ncbi:MAG: hypothetical protein ACOX65_05510 [Anaerotruncus rubiinfantis]|jgi:hypothetical protein|uniref:hypothetical protein n=1 Tax=Anaerotruncus rubiinfantis TaxID=1720200 RepID=UPI0011CC0AD3|nr:hypothetical protein [Anaerotruncus rubiinfantis]
MLDQNDLQAIAMLINESIGPIKEELKELKAGQGSLVAMQAATNERLNSIDERLSNLEEDSKVTRASVNTLLDWAEDAQIEVKIPLYKKAQ